MNKPFFSIIVPAYNVEKYISQALDSVLDQTYTSYEILLIDDKSTDKTLEIAKKYQCKSKKIKLICNSKNTGLAATRNVGLNKTTGKYIVFLDSDDFFNDKDFLKKLYLYCIEADCVYYGCSWYFENNSKTAIQDTTNIEKANSYKNKHKMIKFLSNNGYLYHNIFRIACKKDFLSANRLCFDDNLRQAEDLDLFYRILYARPKIASFNSNQYMWRQDNENSLTKNHKEQLKYANIVFLKLYELIYAKTKNNKYDNVLLSCIGSEFTSYIIDCCKTFERAVTDKDIYELSKLKIFLKYGKDKKSRTLHKLTLLLGWKKGLYLFLKIKN